jgi:WD40 repeat protein
MKDSRIYVWNREHGTLIDTIEGHTGSCNCVAWNPVEAFMFASAGDDHEIRMYTHLKNVLMSDGRIQVCPLGIDLSIY